MPCYSPLKAWRSKTRNANGKRNIVFKRKDAYTDMEIQLPCGQCVGCRLEKSRQWAIRCLHESKLHSDNCFITLTYSEENLPKFHTLVKSDFQKFMKRLRKKFSDIQIRYYACGEYGGRTNRPHYHALIFGLDFDDKILYKDDGTNRIYISETLEKIWGKGFCTIGSVTFETAAYTARYVMKKQTGEDSDEKYERVCGYTGEISVVEKEFSLMSRRPGIGAKHYDKYKKEIKESDSVIIRGREMKPPKFYDAMYEVEDEKEFQKMKHKRRSEALRSKDRSPERLEVREEIAKAKLKRSSRSYEEQY